MREETGVTAEITALVERREVADPPVETPGGVGPADGFTPLHLHVTFPGKVSTAGIDKTFLDGVSTAGVDVTFPDEVSTAGVDVTFLGEVSTAGCRRTAPLGSEML